MTNGATPVLFGDLSAQDAQGLEEAGVVAFDVFDALRETAASFFLELLVDGDGLFAVEQGFAALGGFEGAKFVDDEVAFGDEEGDDVADVAVAVLFHDAVGAEPLEMVCAVEFGVAGAEDVADFAGAVALAHAA